MRYELIYIIDTALDEEARKALITRVSETIAQNGGEIEAVEEWGKRRLAYEINDKPDGYYVLLKYSANPEVPKEIERILEISDDILRYLTTRIEVKTSRVKPRTQQQRSYAREASPKVQEAELPEQEQEE
ncbi:MAG TPA: 30S ribosomal protein S6 [Christensenellaceae bacterium]|jgi:small subunit ribosomal protein S6|nr:30S ribosomal protein S6 [Christensenellaceae bacterium]